MCWLHTPSLRGDGSLDDSRKGLHRPHLICEKKDSRRMGLCFCTTNMCLLYTPELSQLPLKNGMTVFATGVVSHSPEQITSTDVLSGTCPYTMCISGCW